MRKTIMTMMATTLVLATAALTGPAAATKYNTVAGGCVARGAECTTLSSDGGMKFCFDNSKAGQGTQCVHCPGDLTQNKDCTMALTGGRKGTTIERVMKAPARKAVQ
jgi:hypothetical protein